MRKLPFLIICGAIAWFSLSPVFYFIIGPGVGQLPSYLRMTSGDTEIGCASFLKDWERAFPASGAYCERVPRWRHWLNSVQNVGYQLEVYKTLK